MKICQICGSEIPQRKGREGGWKKNCSYDCKKESLRRWESIEVSKQCRLCKKEFRIIRRYKSKRKYCGDCVNKAKSIAKTKEKNPNWVGGRKHHKKPRYSLRMRRHNFVCRQFRKVFIDKHGYEFCEVCKISNPAVAFKFDTHHLYYASREPKNENLHHPKNLIVVCRSCHSQFHAGEYKDLFSTLEKERGLKELFASGKRVKEPPVFDYRANEPTISSQ